MAFRLPTFNLPVNVWRGTSLHTNPPDVITVGNLSPGKLVTSFVANALFGGSGGQVTEMLLRLPALTDVRDGILGGSGRDQIEVPAGSGRFYVAVYVDDIAKGFANEHRYALLSKGAIPWPEPLP